jgi:hypothetical protein
LLQEEVLEDEQESELGHEAELAGRVRTVLKMRDLVGGEGGTRGYRRGTFRHRL